MKSLFFFACIGAWLLLVSCSSNSSSTENTENSTLSNATTESSSTLENKTNSPVEAVAVLDKVSVLETPTEKGKWLTSASLGEKFTLLGETTTDNSSSKPREYTKVRLQDGKEGWVRSDLIVPNGKCVVIRDLEVPIFSRPDMLTKTNKSFSKLDVVAIKSTKDNTWMEVVGKRKGGEWLESGWVKSGHHTELEVDLAVAVYYHKAMAMKEQDKKLTELKSIITNTDFSGSVFIEDMRNEITTLEGGSTETSTN
jgi:hypothetical protein